MSRIKIASSANFCGGEDEAAPTTTIIHWLEFAVCSRSPPSLLNQAKVRFNCKIFNDDRLSGQVLNGVAV